jgi:hypothetical protein
MSASAVAKVTDELMAQQKLRGHPPAPAPGQWSSVIKADVGRQSEKPEAVPRMIE